MDFGLLLVFDQDWSRVRSFADSGTDTKLDQFQLGQISQLPSNSTRSAGFWLQQCFWVKLSQLLAFWTTSASGVIRPGPTFRIRLDNSGRSLQLNSLTTLSEFGLTPAEFAPRLLPALLGWCYSVAAAAAGLPAAIWLPAAILFGISTGQSDIYALFG